MHKKYLSTGQVAKKCSVTTDTVLKWIKRGKIKAYRTAGGHYRIAENEINYLDLKDDIDSTDIDNNIYCWEFMSKDGTINEKCQTCLVYRTKAKTCYKLAGLEDEAGVQKSFCDISCQYCNYLKNIAKITPKLLVITENNNLINDLIATIRTDKFELCFSNSNIEKVNIANLDSPAQVLIDYNLIKQQKINKELLENK